MIAMPRAARLAERVVDAGGDAGLLHRDGALIAEAFDVFDRGLGELR
jgi:hypothetical protein